MSMIVPTRLPDGSEVWIAPEVLEFTQDLEAVHPNLALVRNRDASWSIWFVANDGQEFVIANSRPYAKLDRRVIEHLRHGNLERPGQSIIEDIIQNNDRIIEDRERKAVEAIMEAKDKVMSVAYKRERK